MWDRWKRLWISSALLVLIVIVFGQTGRFDFINYDDPEYVLENRHVNGPVTSGSLVWAFTTGYAGNWLPLTWISHMLDFQLFGLNSGYHHLINVGLHALSSVLLFAALFRMTRDLWPSAFVAAVFALHPLRAESIAWIAERKDVLSTFFWLLAVWCYARYAERPNTPRYLSVIAACTLGLMAKPMVVTLPFALLLLDIWPLHRLNRANLRQRILEKLPMVALSAAVSIVSYVVQRNEGAVSSLAVVPFFYRIENAVVSYAMYLKMTAWPSRLAPLYPLPMTMSAWQPLIALSVIAAVSVLVFRWGRSRPYLVAGWLWYLGTLVPVLGLVAFGAQARADRYTYVPQIGILLMIAWGMVDVMHSHPRLRTLMQAGAVAALSVFAALTAIQVSYWRDSITLFRHTIGVSPENYMAYNNLGAAFSKQGRLDEAIECYKKAMDIPRRFNLADPYTNMGAAMLSREQPADAVPYLLQALQYEPRSAKAHANLGVALDDLGRTPEALTHFREAVQISPEDPEAQAGLGLALARTGAGDEALAHLREALRIRPDFAGAYFDLGEAYGLLSRNEEAERAFRESIRLDPSNPRAYVNLGISLGVAGKFEEAIPAFRSAIKLRPDDGMAWFNLGSALAQNGQLREAAGAFGEAVRLQPDAVEARQALAEVQNLLQQRP